MTDRGAGQPDAAGGPVRHVPVLVERVIEFLDPRDRQLIIDATFGGGGYARAILAAADCRVIGIDRDPEAIALGADLVRDAAGRLTLVQEKFSALAEVAADVSVDGVVLDLGLSSLQLDRPERGFSFRFDAPLDMRMGRSGPTAADVLASASEQNLALVISSFGEERRARAIARAVVARRRDQRIETTGQLADIVAGVVRARPGGIHPATRTFQALRVLVNDELGELQRGLIAAERVLKPGGRLVVVAFHSLEDRIVKTFLALRARAPAGSRHRPVAVSKPVSFRVLTRRPVTPSEQEIAGNPRARSAKLRAGERTDAPAVARTAAAMRLPALAEIIQAHR